MGEGKALGGHPHNLYHGSRRRNLEEKTERRRKRNGEHTRKGGGGGDSPSGETLGTHIVNKADPGLLISLTA